MDDERDQPRRPEPLWPPDTQPAPQSDISPAPESAPRSAPDPAISDAQTARVSVPPLSQPPSVADTVADAPTQRLTTPPQPSIADTVADAPTQRLTTPPQPSVSDTGNDTVADAPTQRLTTPPQPSVADAPTQRLTTPPRPSISQDTSAPSEAETARVPAQPPQMAQPPQIPPPSTQAAGQTASQTALRTLRRAATWSRKHWRLVTAGVVVLALIIAMVNIYNYATYLAAQPQKLVDNYCAALTHGDYATAYGLLSPQAQAQTPKSQYLADAAALDAISGHVTHCSGKPAEHLSALSFLRSPRSVMIDASLTRSQQAETGQIALVRDATGWHVAELSSSLRGVDLGPLHTEQAFCQALVNRKYGDAFNLLTAPYQSEQGGETKFTQTFGSSLAITGCAPGLHTYQVNGADQRASLTMTISLTVTGSGVSSKLTLPASMTLVREAAGWRVDTITPNVSQ